MQLIPALDLLGTDAVRLEKGDYDRVLFRQDIDDFLDRLIATSPPLLHIVDLEAARSGQLRPEMAQRCVARATDVPVQFSGGIRSLEDAHTILNAGVSRIIIGTAVWSDPDALATYVSALGEQLVVAFDVRDGRLAVRGWLADAGLSVEEALVACRQAGVRRLHVTAISRDGTMQGPDLSLYAQVCTSGIPVVAAGGVRNDDDLAALEAVGCEGAVMGMGMLQRLGITIAPQASGEPK
jgi:phosphoribosylformimino-5-aminoimidazole carboxamide ribotide isomerase